MFSVAASSALAVALAAFPMVHNQSMAVATTVFDTKIHLAIQSLDVDAGGRTIVGSNENGHLFLVDIPTRRLTNLPCDLGATTVCLSENRQTVFLGGHGGGDDTKPGCLAVYDIPKQRVVGLLPLAKFVRRVMKAGAHHVLCLINEDEVVCVDVSDPARPTIRGPRFTNVLSLITDDQKQPVLLFNNGGLLVTDRKKEFQLTVPALRCRTSERIGDELTFGLSQDTPRRMVSTNGTVIHLDTEGSGIGRTSWPLLDRSPLGLYSWGTDWVVCDHENLFVLNDQLRLKAKVSVRIKESSLFATTSAFTIINDAAVVVVGKDDGKVVLFTLRRTAKK
ncbi:hypothetical protein [Fimbriiglobus ruber]|uniref:hypothetical protein n=1 Tax=Fimbriiglobus ruber TaxID=1908690 RepID=UPI000B4A7CB9|nr:hypothetical protein [Fimbriiglobus ruber]